jgi:hypothetical protein
VKETGNFCHKPPSYLPGQTLTLAKSYTTNFFTPLPKQLKNADFSLFKVIVPNFKQALITQKYYCLCPESSFSHSENYFTFFSPQPSNYP